MGANPPPAALTAPAPRARARVLLAVVPFALFLRTFVLAPLRIPTDSMEPTLRPGDRVVVARTLYAQTGSAALDRWLPVRAPRRGDVVWVDSPLAPGELLVKRCAATERQSFRGAKVPDGHLAVVGDHRDDSLDSRVFGPLPLVGVRGRVVFVLFSTRRDDASWRDRMPRRVR